jgi:hypothetical protein
MLLEDEGWDLDLLSNKNKVNQHLKKLRPYNLRKLRRLRRLRRLRLMSINLYQHQSNNIKKNKNGYNQVKQVADLESQARNHSNISKVSYDLSQPQPLTSSSASLLKQEGLPPVNLYKRFNNKYLIKHNDNKLKFIIN